MSKIIIGIHGLGNKPPKDLLNNWWNAAIKEGLKHISKPHPFFKFELVYWADLLHPFPENPKEKNPENELFMDEPYCKSSDWSSKEKDSNRKTIQKFIEKQLDKILVNSDGSLNFSSITDKIVHHYFHDLEVYYTTKSIKDEVRERLYSILTKYKKKDILLIAHSMGSIISYDVLCGNPESVKINTFATIGSPLGFPIIKAKLILEKPDDTALSVPENVKNHWYNFSDLEDKVAFNFDLADDYSPNQAGVSIIDFEVNNNYVYKDLHNPHKSYGYLRSPEMANTIDEFLLEGKPKFAVWLIRKINKLFSKYYSNGSVM